MIERHRIADREQWLALRGQDITGTTVAALPALDVHERLTPAQLYHHHAGTEPFSTVQTAPMERGEVVEPGAIRLIAKRNPTWRVIQPGEYYRIPELRLGGTPDAIVETPDRGLGVIDVKSVHGPVFASQWIDEAGGISPPMAAALQVILYKHLVGADFAMIAPVRIGFGVECDLVEVEEPPGLWDRIVDAAAEFWRMIEAGTPPPPSYPRDTDLVLRMYRAVEPGLTVDLSGNNEVPALRDRDADLALIERAACEERRSLKAQLVAMMGEAEVALFNGETIATAKNVTRKAHSVPATTYRNVTWKKERTA